MVVLAMRDRTRPRSRMPSSRGSRRSGMSSRSGRRRASSRGARDSALRARRRSGAARPAAVHRGEREQLASLSRRRRSWLELVVLEVEVGGDVLLLLGEIALAELRRCTPAPARAAAPASSPAVGARVHPVGIAGEALRVAGDAIACRPAPCRLAASPARERRRLRLRRRRADGRRAAQQRAQRSASSRRHAQPPVGERGVTPPRAARCATAAGGCES